MAYASKAIANLLIDVAKDSNKLLDQMQLQKLVYITHGWHLAITEKPLISDDIQAWQYGPVIPVLYEEFKNCGKDKINDYATDIRYDDDDFKFHFDPPRIDEGDSFTEELAQKVWDKYGHLSGPQLSNLTHLPNTPWEKVYSSKSRKSIPNNLIKDHFTGLLQA